MSFSEKIISLYKTNLFSRQDPIAAIPYFTSSDFPHLTHTTYSFPSSRGHMLSGHLYEYRPCTENRILIFDHGMGAGHRAYLREIALLAEHGFRVFTYDHTGCAESEGENTNGFAQSLSDLNDCLIFLKGDVRFADCSFAVIGHSWGGYAVLNIGTLHPDLTHIVSLSGFASVPRMLEQQFPKPLSALRRSIAALEQEANPALFSCSAEQALRNTEAKVLLIHSPNDKLVSMKHHFFYLQKELKDRKNTRFLVVPKRGHNPNYTPDALCYKNAFFAALTKAMKKKALATESAQVAFASCWDIWRMTEQDSEIWNEIFRHFAT